MCRLQCKQHTAKPLTELGSLLLPEVLELVGKHHGLSEFYNTFRTSVADLWTTINRKKVIQQRRDEISKQMEALTKEKKQLDTEIDMIEQNEMKECIVYSGSVSHAANDSRLHSQKRARMH